MFCTHLMNRFRRVDSYLATVLWLLAVFVERTIVFLFFFVFVPSDLSWKVGSRTREASNQFDAKLFLSDSLFFVFVFVPSVGL